MNGFAVKLAAAALVTGVLAIATAAVAAEPIVGTWKTKEGALARISSCGSSYCIHLTSGDFAGMSIGKMSGKGAKYSGSIKDPRSNRTYSGSANVSGSKMRLKGCALMVFCQTQNWHKQ